MSILRRFGIWLWQVIDTHAERIKIISGFAVGVFVLIEYLDKQNDEKVNRALDYVRIYHSQQLLEARFNNDPAISYVTKGGYLMDELREARGESARSGAVVLDPADDRKEPPAPAPATEARKLRYVHTLQNFYAPVAQCAITELCDPRILCQSFFPDVQMFKEDYLRVFKELGDDWLRAEVHFMDAFLKFCESDPTFLK